MRISQEQLKEVAEGLSGEIESEREDKKGASVVALYGELGSGKTTFTKEVGKYFGIREPIISPTFVIEKIYKIDNSVFENLVHIDAYRLESAEELKGLGWSELLEDPHNLVIIEWPENISEALPEEVWNVEFAFIDENTREIKINKP